MFGLQPLHILVIVIVALIIFGPKRLPKIGRWIGRMFSEFRRGARDMADGVREGMQDTSRPPAAPGACPSCGAENPSGARFCNECGGRLAV